MNFLAHLYLTYPHSDWSVGNVIGDMVRPVQLPALPEEIAHGVRTHRQIDAMADAHPAFRELTRLLRPAHRKYTPVVVDLLLDHTLALHWDAFDIGPNIGEFLDWSYGLMEAGSRRVGDPVASRLARMAATRWFDNYLTEEGMERVLSGMDTRARFPSRFNRALDDLGRHDAEFVEALHHILDDISQAIYASAGFPNLRSAARS